MAFDGKDSTGNSSGRAAPLRDFVLSQPRDMSLKDVVLAAKAAGLSLEKKTASNIRWRANMEQARLEGIALRGKPAAAAPNGPRPRPRTKPSAATAAYDAWEASARAAAAAPPTPLPAVAADLVSQFRALVVRIGTVRCAGLLRDCETSADRIEL